jgi:hypothetical protein
MAIYQVGNKWYVDLYINGRRMRRAIGGRKEAVWLQGELIWLQ